MIDTELIRNCVMQVRRSFDAARIAGLTGVNVEVIKRALTELEIAG
jgi:hypothetical protein